MHFGEDAVVFDRSVFPRLLSALARRGYTPVGPTVRDGAIVYDRLDSEADLPIGWTDEQEGGTYRLHRRDDEALFGYVVGPHSWKQLLFPPRSRLWSARLTREGLELESDDEAAPRHAFIGVRACELAAIAIQDRVFLEGAYVDPIYRARREGAFLVAVNCGQAGRTCFCVSMETGPRATRGFDLALTELLDGDRHEFLAEPGTDRGRELLAELPHHGPRPEDLRAARARVERATGQMGRRMDTRGIKELLYDNPDHARWDDVAARCLTCANCTLVCPTCFCSTVEDASDLTGAHAERWRRWDSCFTQEFSHLYGGSVRVSAKARYRQWMTHKLASWIDQFDSSGCVGCGRCITWCPVGIDITEEVRDPRTSDTSGPARAREHAMSKGIHDILISHPFFEGIDYATLEFICGCGRNVRFDADEQVCREGDPADSFYALREGRVAVQTQVPGRGPLTIMTLQDGDILGWSWLFPPYRWMHDVVALEPTRAVSFDAVCLRRKCEENTAMGYRLMKRFAQLFARRVAATRLQILDVYGTTPSL